MGKNANTFVYGDGFGGLDLLRGGPTTSHWVGYIDVDRLNPRVEKLTRLGGKVLAPGLGIPDVGRIAVLGDPSGRCLRSTPPRQLGT